TCRWSRHARSLVPPPGGSGQAPERERRQLWVAEPAAHAAAPSHWSRAVVSELELECLPVAEFPHLPVTAHPDRRELARAAADKSGVVHDGQCDNVVAVENGELERAETLGPVGVEPQDIVAGFHACEASLQHVDGSCHRGQVYALGRRAALDV